MNVEKMKKGIAWILCILMSFSIVTPNHLQMVVGEEITGLQYEVKKELLHTTFDGFDNTIDGEVNPESWIVPDANRKVGQNNVIGWTDEVQGNVAQLITKTKGNIVLYHQPALMDTDQVLLEAKVNFQDSNLLRRLFIVRNKENKLVNTLIAEGNSIKIDKIQTPLLEYKLNQWYHIQILLDPISGKYEVYIDGDHKGSYEMVTGGEITEVRFAQVGAENQEGSILLDDIKIMEVAVENSGGEQPGEQEPDGEEPPIEEGNILENGSFERVVEETGSEWNTAQKPAGWSTWKPTGNPIFELVEDVVYDGQYAICIRTQELGRGSASSPFIPVVPGRKYIVSAKVKTEEMEQLGAKAQARVRVTPYDGAEAQIQGMYKETSLIKGNKDWQTVFVEYDVPSNAAYLKIGLFMENSTNARIWFDDVKVEAFVPVTSIDLGEDKEIVLGDSFQIEPVVEPVTGSKAFTWHSSNESIATVVDGKVTGVGIGEATITAKWAYDDQVMRSMKVIVTKDLATHVDVTGIAFNQEGVEIVEKGFGNLSWCIEPKEATIQEVKFEVADPSIVQVQENGDIIGLKKGETTVKVITVDGSYEATCIVSVVEAEKDEFDTMREYWKAKIVGTPYDETDQKVQEILQKAEEKAMTHWTTMNKAPDREYLWDNLRKTDKEVPPAKANSAHVRSMYLNLMDMAKVYQLPGSSLYGNQELLTDIIEALDWLSEHHYYAGKAPYSNWWQWEIGIPVTLNDIVVLLYEELSPVQIKKYMDAIEYFQPDPTKSGANAIGTTSPNLREAVGANRVDVSKVVAVRGVIVKDGEKIAAARDALSQVFEYVEVEDGFYQDGSFIQHETIPYTGSYGEVLISGVASLLDLLHGTTWEVTDPNVENIYKAVIHSFEPLLYKGAVMDMVSGRSVARPVGDHGRGRGIINSILRLIPAAPAHYAEKYQSLVKTMIVEDTFQPYLESIGNMQLYNAAKEIVEDPHIPKRDSYVKHISFPSMDRVVHHRPGYAFGIASHSKRVGNYEAMNNENTKGWYSGDGMTYLYNEDLGHYTDYWPTVNPYRLPGTTEDTELRQDNSGQKRNRTKEKGMSSKAWVGGVSIAEKYGTWGMDFASWDESLEAKKSWFLFDDEIVAIGAGIKSEKANVSVETTIENRKLNKEGTNRIIIGTEEEEKNIGTEEERINEAHWAHVEGSVPGSDIGYYFPRHQNLFALRDTREGSYKEINYSGSAEPITNHFFTLWLDHGEQPAQGQYEYVLLPNKTVEETKKYAQNPEIVILSNTEEVQAVKNTKLNLTGIHFWTDTKQTVGKVTSNRKAAVIIQENEGTMEIAVSDPTMENTETIELEIDQVAYQVLSQDPRITVQQLEPTIQLSVQVQDAKGQSFAVQLGTQKPPKEEDPKEDSTDSTEDSTVSTKEDPKPSLEKQIKEGLKQKEEEIILPFTEKEIKVSLPHSLLKETKASGKKIMLENKAVRVEIPNVLADHINQPVEIKVNVYTKEEKANTNPLLQSLHKGIKIETQDIPNLGFPVTVSLTPEEVEKIGKRFNVNLYQWNTEKNQWDYVNEKLTWEKSKVRFTAKPFETYTLMEYTKKFKDIENHWSKGSVERIGAKHILDEMSPQDFYPDQPIPRAEFAAILVKSIGGESEKADTSVFTDINDQEWYAKDLKKATELGLIQGKGDSLFDPEGELTREALVVMVMRAYGYITGEEAKGKEENLSFFEDANEISAWAQQEVASAYENGLIRGISKKEFAPHEVATRAQAVTILDRLLHGRQ